MKTPARSLEAGAPAKLREFGAATTVLAHVSTALAGQRFRADQLLASVVLSLSPRSPPGTGSCLDARVSSLRLRAR
jgi:hypothetical protein